MSDTIDSPSPAEGFQQLLAELRDIDDALERGDATDEETSDDDLKLVASIAAEGRFATETAEVIDDLLALDERVPDELRARLVAAAGRGLSENRLRSGRLEPLLRRDRLERGLSYEDLADEIGARLPAEPVSPRPGVIELEEVERGLAAFESLGARAVAEWIRIVVPDKAIGVRALALSTPALASAAFAANDPRSRAKAVDFVRQVAELLDVEPPTF